MIIQVAKIIAIVHCRLRKDRKKEGNTAYKMAEEDNSNDGWHLVMPEDQLGALNDDSPNFDDEAEMIDPSKNLR